ncbi:putative aspartate aminotransferase, cytoplasmic [Violaceomyces palustris]|uniref:Aspartate aminotransferase, cytoplasmic n=1 Tax=Violaceomyces palustris TaxID=1673888 RepID=A0ACD0P552_9BASI|nr:putative aspartate aminotransferase, cytoplasmic [Violaceomyces palustris]
MATDRLNNINQHISGSAGLAQRAAKVFESVPLAPPDAIFKLTASYKADTYKQKVNLGVGAYRDDDGKPWVLPSVKKAQSALIADESVDHEYLSITGLPEFTSNAAKLILGADSAAISENRVASVQTISGTGANHLGAVFLSKFYEFAKLGADREIFISNPTWANHKAIFSAAGIKPVDYPYYDPKTIALDFEGFTSTLRSAKDNSIFLLHACAHNPTGVDPTREQWHQIADIFAEKGHFAFFDCAYQGFASGDLDRDAYAVRHFVSKRSIPLLICQSFAKNAGLYGERVGALHVVSSTPEQNKAVLSQLSVIQRSEISNPPAFGARVVSMILTDPNLLNQWQEDVSTMAGRIIEMRKRLHSILTEEKKTPGNWDHILKQIGMFTFLGLNPEQCQRLLEQGHIYLTSNSRISMAGLTTKNVEYVAEWIDKVVRGN